MNSESQKKPEWVGKITSFVTNEEGGVFALRNLPEVIKGALFSRYSRSELSIRDLLFKEFMKGEDLDFAATVGGCGGDFNGQILAIEKANNFYNRILDSFGDDSIGELGGAHLALEDVSMLAAKVIEDSRIGGSPLEKSTRYIRFDQKYNDKYRYYRDPVIMNSEFAQEYESTCDNLFETYAALIPKTKELISKLMPNEGLSAGVYAATLNAKVLDCLRGLLPASTLTNVGMFGNGRFWQGLIQRLSVHPLQEMNNLGQDTYRELSKIIPSFLTRANSLHKNQIAHVEFSEKVSETLKAFQPAHLQKVDPKNENREEYVSLVKDDLDAESKVAAALLFPDSEYSTYELEAYIKTKSTEDINDLFASVSSFRKNRRNKSPRALENAVFTFEITADFGAYRDLQRHRILTQERQLLTTNLGYYVPDELLGTEMLTPYLNALEDARETYDKIAEKYKVEAQYVVPMAYNIRWYKTINLRALQWLCELRSQAAGHIVYRKVAQQMAALVIKKHPLFANFLTFVDNNEYSLGRAQSEQRAEKKKMSV